MTKRYKKWLRRRGARYVAHPGSKSARNGEIVFCKVRGEFVQYEGKTDDGLHILGCSCLEMHRRMDFRLMNRKDRGWK